MRITNKTKKILIKYFGVRKTERIINEAIISFNTLDKEKVEEILNMCGGFSEAFWDDYATQKSNDEQNKEFEYLYDLCWSKRNLNFNTQLIHRINTGGKVEITKVTNGENK